jgi:hypothetical protein
LYNGFLYIYKTPDSTDYTIQLTGSEVQDELSSDGEYPSIPAQLAWGLIWSVLHKIAEVNGDDKASTKYEIKIPKEKKDWKVASTRKNSTLDAVPPYSLL